MNKVYISGPMTGYAEFNYPAFHVAARKLKARGYQVVNPADVDAGDGWEWSDYLKADIAQLITCTHIHMLPGWRESRGARLERFIADQIGIRVLP